MRPRRRIPRRAPLQLAAQIIGMRTRFPQGEIIRSGRSFTWQGTLSPLDGCRAYTVKLVFSQGKHPQVFVVEPDLLALSGGRRLPHVYDQAKQKLCLYLPAANFWTSDKSAANTVMKWALAWLTFFELWLVTDTWHGRGVGHPGDDPTLYNF